MKKPVRDQLEELAAMSVPELQRRHRDLLGYDADRSTKQLVPNESEAAIVKWMFTEAAAGKKPASIAEAANGRGCRTKVSVALRSGNKRGGNLWTARQVVATLRNPVHIGMLRDGDGARLGCQASLVSDAVFTEVAETLDARRTRRPGAIVYGPIWPLKGLSMLIGFRRTASEMRKPAA